MERSFIGNTLAVVMAASMFPLASNAATYSTLLDFQADDQSMWQAGDAWQLNWRQDIPLYDWDYSFESPRSVGLPQLIPFAPPLPQFSVYGHTDGNIGLSPYLNIDSGSVDASYNLNVTIETPDDFTVSPGETFTISTGYASQGTGSFTTNFPEIQAGVDILFGTHASAGVNIFDGYRCGFVNAGSCWDATASQTWEFVGLTVDPDEGIAANALGIPIGPFDAGLIYDDEGRIPGLQFHNDTISILGLAEVDLLEEWSLGGYADISLNVPDINTTGSEATGFTAEGEDDLFRFSVDADKIALDIVDKVVQAAIAAGTAGAGSGALAIDFPDLEGSSNLEPIIGETLASLIPIELSYNILDIEPFLDIDVRQEFLFTPNDLMVSFDLGNGTITDPISVGEEISLIMPDGGFEMTPIYSLPDTLFSNLTELMIDLGIDVTMLDFGLDFTGILGLIPSIDPDPLFHEDLTLNEILTVMNIPTGWMNPDIFNQQFAFNFDPITQAAIDIAPYTGSGGGGGGGGGGNGGVSVPEPSTTLLLSAGLLTMLVAGSRRKKRGLFH
ncbi:MAG: PEP-CTERM sorting domain-containing protein [Candidatus Thiodiazotropha sp. (ex Lucinoma borealis)]|nr:PEP-CTERM sorting domain-containing protein [Candidatus Thiodiazotropha sp. (ex Lucinoma borealis)]